MRRRHLGSGPHAVGCLAGGGPSRRPLRPFVAPLPAPGGAGLPGSAVALQLAARTAAYGRVWPVSGQLCPPGPAAGGGGAERAAAQPLPHAPCPALPAQLVPSSPRGPCRAVCDRRRLGASPAALPGHPRPVATRNRRPASLTGRASCPCASAGPEPALPGRGDTQLPWPRTGGRRPQPVRAADAAPAAPPGLLMLCAPCRAQVKSVRRRDKKASVLFIEGHMNPRGRG